MDFTNKVAIVTGAASGIGKATAELFARKGARVVVSDVNEEGGEETVRLIEEAGGTALFCRADVSQREEVIRLFKTALASYGGIDCVVNNAGIGGTLSFTHEYPLDIYERIMAVNVNGVFYCMQEALKLMLEQDRGGAIVNLASVAGIGAASRMSAYVMSKHAVIGLTKTAAAEYGKYNIRVNAVCPTIIETPMGMEYLEGNEEVMNMIKATIPMKRFGQAEEVAEAIVWLCSEQSGFVTGEALRVDGGMKA